MTLNISLVTRWGIHQSADFRLYDANKEKVFRDNSAKLLHVTYKRWFGCVTYCGIGRWNNMDTCEWLKKWLVSNSNLRFEEFIQLIENEGNKWLKNIFTKINKVDHTFTIAAFVDGKPQIAILSNYYRIDAPNQPELLNNLVVTRTSINRKKLIITGRSKAVVAEDKSLLLSLGRPLVDIFEIQRIMKSVNARSAVSSVSKNQVSESCWVYSILPNGSGEGKYYGNVKGELKPVTLVNGLDIHDLIKRIPGVGPKTQVLGTYFTNTKAQSTKSPVECTPIIKKTKLPSSIKKIDVIDLGNFGGITTRAHAINNQAHVVGESFLTTSGPNHAFFWNGESIVDIGTLGGRSSIAHDINEEDQVVGISTLNKIKGGRAFLWQAHKEMINLGALGGRKSVAEAVNNLGQVVGSSETAHGKKPEDRRTRAFLWDDKNGMISLGTLQNSWSKALDINDQGHVVGNSHKSGSVRGFFWTEPDGMIDIGTLGGNFCRALAINNNDQVVGRSKNASGDNRPFIWSKESGMTEIPISGKVVLRDINDYGIIIGYIETEFGYQAFAWSESMGLISLPRYEYHRSEALSINNSLAVSGLMLGREGHCHGVIWKMKLK